MAGPVPAIHGSVRTLGNDVDAPVAPGHEV